MIPESSPQELPEAPSDPPRGAPTEPASEAAPPGAPTEPASEAALPLPATTFRVEELDDAGMDALLQRQRIGRLAYTDGRRVEIRPLGYVREGEWIFGRMEAGGKVEALRHLPWVAFQVDDIGSPWAWESVLLHGPLHFLPEGEGGPEGARVRTHALRALEKGIPGFGTAADPGGHRTLLFGILPQERRGLRGHTGD